MSAKSKSRKQRSNETAPDFKKESFQAERTARVRPITAKTENQKVYLDSLQKAAVTIGRGSAGTGKTWCAAMVAANKYLKGEIKKIVVTRPNVGMGKSTGFWPGTIEDKLRPYLLPILNTLEKVLGTSLYQADFGKKILIQPLETVRGMSYEPGTYIIVDEAQNTTVEEMRSLITRPEEGCQIVFCGDDSQKDVPGLSGITYMSRIIENHFIDDDQLNVINFTSDDIVRGGIVKRMVMIFDDEGPASKIK